MTDPRIVPIPRQMIGDMWMHVAPHLLKGLSKATDVTLQQVADDLVNGTDQLWCVLHKDRVLAAFLTAVYLDEEHGTKFLGVYGLGGTEIEIWGRELGDKMLEAAIAAGCTSVRFTGREAWSRVLPNYRITGQRLGEAIFERAAQ